MRADRLAKVREALHTKRRIKRQILSERHLRTHDGPPVPVDAIPIRVLDINEWVHYPATPADIRSVLRLLPTGMVDGVSRIELSLGTFEQEDRAHHLGYEIERDPYTGRRGDELLPGCYVGQILGQYLHAGSRIRLFAVVYDKSMPNREMWELWLRLGMLATLAHELGHHEDRVWRGARGRWRADRRDPAEVYAERTEHDLVQSYIVPYLEQTYPEQIAALNAWLDQHGGVTLPLAVLAGEPRATTRDGGITGSSIFSIKYAVESLAQDVAKGEPLVRTRTRFARDLHYAERDTEALAIIDRMLAEQMQDVGVRTLQAHIFACQERYDLALPIASQVVAEDDTSDEAWAVLADAYEAQADWPNVIRAVTQYLELNEYRGAPRRLAQRARAFIELGALADAEPDIVRLERFRSGLATRRAAELRERIATLHAEPITIER